MTTYITLLGWPAAVAAFFSRYSLSTAVSVTIIYGYLFLPRRPVINLPLLPSLDKNTVPALAALLFVIVALQRFPPAERPGLIPRGFLVRTLMIGFLLSGLGTAYMNSDTLVYGSTVLGGISVYDGMSAGLFALTVLIPLLIGYACLAKPKEKRVILYVLAVAGVIYSILGLYEMRMSPQLNIKIYGFFPHEWVQHRRGSGWRPIVFLEHGLFVASFLSIAAIAAFGLFRLQAKGNTRKGLWLAIITSFTLILSGNLTGTLILLVCGSIVLFTSTRFQILAAAAISAIVLLYPLARGANLIPIDLVLSAAESISERRAESLEFRLDQEEIHLEKARERPLFGWGGWGRSLIYENSGRLISVRDGYWIIIFGDGGLARYLTEMGLLCMPILLLAWRRKTLALEPETAVVALLLAANLIDLMPNAGITPITWLLAGSLWGRLALGQIKSEEDQPQDGPVEPLSVYTRQRTPIDRTSRRADQPQATQYQRPGETE